jgi:hypothetical protein
MFPSSGHRRGRRGEGRNQSDGQFRSSFTLLLNTGIKTGCSVTQSISSYSSVSLSALLTFQLKTETHSVSIWRRRHIQFPFEDGDTLFPFEDGETFSLHLKTETHSVSIWRRRHIQSPFEDGDTFSFHLKTETHSVSIWRRRHIQSPQVCETFSLTRCKCQKILVTPIKQDLRQKILS